MEICISKLQKIPYPNFKISYNAVNDQTTFPVPNQKNIKFCQNIIKNFYSKYKTYITNLSFEENYSTTNSLIAELLNTEYHINDDGTALTVANFLQSLNLSWSNINLEKDYPNLSKLKVLSLYECRNIKDPSFYEFSLKCRKIEELNISFTDISLKQISEKLFFENLKKVKFNDCLNIQQQSFYNFFQNHPNLEQVSLSGANFKLDVNNLPILPNLQKLDISACIEELNKEDLLKILKQYPKLSKLNFDEIKLSDDLSNLLDQFNDSSFTNQELINKLQGNRKRKRAEEIKSNKRHKSNPFYQI